MKSDRKAWSDAGTAVSRLRGNAKTALGGLEHGQKGASVKGGVLSAAAQREVYESWKRYLEAVSGRCGAIQEVLEKAGKMQHQNDGEISKEFDSMRGRYKDTPAIGGQEGK
ncbi:hypothetical protein ACIHFE_34075 [Streptomyces sp. NPDC052396]|uniref:hypothetical protein n=1 Tax=Streptomyces sp. NPDC052396 TaxID=3365689 RepID=UPI0037CE3863